MPLPPQPLTIIGVIYSREVLRATLVFSLSSPDIGHLGRYHGHELHVRFQGEIRHVYHRPRHMIHIHGRLNHDGPIGLWNALTHLLRQLSRRVANVNLAACNIILATIKRSRFPKIRDWFYANQRISPFQAGKRI
jgi:hypothetical protein